MAKYISGLSGGSTGYFTDQDGTPRLVLGDAAWSLLSNAGRWNGGDWQADLDGYVNIRAAQGFTVIYCEPFGSTRNGCVYDNGSTHDGLAPFAADGDPSTGLNGAFWARVDYLIAAAAAGGITIFLNAPGGNWDMDTAGYALAGKTTTQFTDYGTALAARYAAVPNLCWMFADDYFGTYDTQMAGLLSGLRGGGDTHPCSIENMSESTSRNTLDPTPPGPSACAWGTAHADFSFCYSYVQWYIGIEAAWGESPQIPTIAGDGFFYNNTTAGDTLNRMHCWWALSSGARGCITGSEGIWQWAASALASAANENWYANLAGKIRAAYEQLSGWHKLLPDTASQLVTAGRGTYGSRSPSGGGPGSFQYSGTSDAYVTASRAPDGTLAVIYLSHPTTITINQAQMAEGYAAKWMDPISGVMTAATTGATYNSAVPGTNSVGGTDWVLVLEQPPYATWTVP